MGRRHGGEPIGGLDQMLLLVKKLNRAVLWGTQINIFSDFADTKAYHCSHV